MKLKNLALCLLTITFANISSASADSKALFTINCSTATGGHTIGHSASLVLKEVGPESYEVEETECTLYHGVCLLPYDRQIEEKVVRQKNVFEGDRVQVFVQNDKVIFQADMDETIYFSESECTLNL